VVGEAITWKRRERSRDVYPREARQRKAKT